MDSQHTPEVEQLLLKRQIARSQHAALNEHQSALTETIAEVDARLNFLFHGLWPGVILVKPVYGGGKEFYRVYSVSGTAVSTLWPSVHAQKKTKKGWHAVPIRLFDCLDKARLASPEELKEIGL